MTFRATFTDGSVVEYEAALPNPEHLTQGWTLEEVSPATIPPGVTPAPATVFGGRRRLTKLEFIQLLGADAVPVLTASQQSAEVQLFIKLIDWATAESDSTSIDLDDPRTIGGLSALEAAGVIGQGRAEEIARG